MDHDLWSLWLLIRPRKCYLHCMHSWCCIWKSYLLEKNSSESSKCCSVLCKNAYQLDWWLFCRLLKQRNSHSPADGFVDQSRATNSGSGAPLLFPAKFDENNVNVSSPTNPRNGQDAVECDMRNVATLKAMDHHPVSTNKAVLLPVTLQPNIFTPSGSGNAIAPIPARVVSDIDNVTSQPQYQFFQSRSHTTDCAVASNKLKEQELTIESGKICISSVYSQGLVFGFTNFSFCLCLFFG